MAVEVGMGCSEFFCLNPKLFRRYRKFYEKKYEHSKKQMDEAGWLGGAYVAQAIGATFSKKGKYPKRPEIYSRNEEGKANAVIQAGVEKKMSDADIFAAVAMKFNMDHFGHTGFGGVKSGKTD